LKKWGKKIDKKRWTLYSNQRGVFLKKKKSLEDIVGGGIKTKHCFREGATRQRVGNSKIEMQSDV